MPDPNNSIVLKPRYYPTLSTIVTAEDLPDILGFLKEGLSTMMNRLYYKDFQYSKSARGDGAFYSLSIVTRKRLDMEIPGTGIYLVLNPSSDNYGTISAFPITVEYQWKILGYLRSFDLSNFTFSPQELFELALRVFNLSEEQILAEIINTFVQPVDENILPLQQFVNDMNTNYGLNIPDVTQDTSLSKVVEELQSESGQLGSILAYGYYIITSDIELTKLKVNILYQKFLIRDLEEYIKDIILPKIKATLSLSAGMEFPRTMLIPVFDESSPTPYEPIPPINPNAPVEEQEPKAIFTFAEALFYADTEQGLGYNMDLVINTVTPVQLGQTGIILNIHNLKIDLSTKTNFPEADADGRPPEFIGVYTEQTDIVLPKKWFSKDEMATQTLKITGKRLLIGTGGISGTIVLEALNTGNPPEETDYFWIKLGTNPEKSWELGYNASS